MVLFDLFITVLQVTGRLILLACRLTGGAVAQSVEHATPGDAVRGSIPAVAASSLLVGSVSVLFDQLRQNGTPLWLVYGSR